MKSFTVMIWTPDSTHDWRDLSVIFGQDFEMNSISDRDSIHIKRALSFIFGLIIKSFTMMTWTPDSTHGWRDMRVGARHDYEAIPCSDRSSIHAWRDMSFTRRVMKAAVHHLLRR